jgi:hypothetical protein
MSILKAFVVSEWLCCCTIPVGTEIKGVTEVAANGSDLQ